MLRNPSKRNAANMANIKTKVEPMLRVKCIDPKPFNWKKLLNMGSVVVSMLRRLASHKSVLKMSR